MKKFITCMTLQKKLSAYRYEAKGNDALEYENETSFPIMTAIHGYVEENEQYKVIVIMQDTDDCKANLEALKNELKALSESTGKPYPQEIVVVSAGQSQSVSSNIDLFQNLIEYVEDEDELFADITFGTKTMSMSLLTAIRYANRLLKRVSVKCIVYGEIDRSVSEDPKEWKAYVYDETAMLSLDEITSTLARQGVRNPKELINFIIEFGNEDGGDSDE